MTSRTMATQAWMQVTPIPRRTNKQIEANVEEAIGI